MIHNLRAQVQLRRPTMT